MTTAEDASVPVSRGALEGELRAPSRDRWVLLGVLALAAVLRISALDRVPPAINQDEAVHAYDAWCILRTGADHYGTPWPVFFRAFGDYHPGPFVYLLVPLQAWWGLGVWTTRLPGAVIGVIGVWLTFECCRRAMGRRVAVWAALLLAVSPWHLHVNRLAFEAGACPTLIVLGLLLGQIGWARLRVAPSSGPRRGSPFVCIFLCGAVFGLAAWFYHAMRLFVPLLLFVLAVVFAGSIRTTTRTAAGRRSAILWLTGLCVGLLPFLREAARAPQSVWARAHAVMAVPADGGIVGAAAVIARNYLRNLSPSFLLFEGDPSAIQSVPGHGQLLWVCAALATVGIAGCLRRWRTDRTGRWLIAWILVAPVPAALAAWPSGHALRGIGALPGWQILAAVGAVGVIDAAGRALSARGSRLAAYGILIALLANSGIFVHRFLTRYPIDAARALQSEWRDVFAHVREHLDPDAPVFVTYRDANQLGMLYLFWNRVDPDHLAESNLQIRDWGTFDRIGRVGRVYFPAPTDPLEYADVRVSNRAYILERPEIAAPGREIRRFTYPDGTDAVVLYELDLSSRPASIGDSSSRPWRESSRLAGRSRVPR